MKRFWLFILSLFTVILVWNFTQAKDYEYTNLNITANILKDWTIDIKEDFTADFFVSKHGIIRDIPLNYSVGWKDFHIEISNINVRWKNFTTNTNNGNIEIKIWDADRTVIWNQNYPISYSTYGLIRNFSGMGYAELYWNLVSYDFDTNINKVRAELILPKIYTWFTKDDFLITTDWKSKTIDWFEWSVDWSQWDKIIITYNKWLPPHQGITLAIKFPNNYFEFNHKRQAGLTWKIWYGYTQKNRQSNKESNNNGSFYRFMWIFIFVRVFIVLYKYFSNSKNNKKFNLNEWKLKWPFADQFPIITQYNPPEWLNSAEVWLLLHRQARTKDMLSLIYKRAYEKFINIEHFVTTSSNIKKGIFKNNIKISKIKDIPCDYPQYEIKFFNNFLVENETIINEDTNLYMDLQLSNLKKYGIEKWWLKENDIWVLWCFLFAVLFLSFFILPLFGKIGMIIYLLLFSLSCILFMFIWSVANKLDETIEWAKLISHILWYREFLAKCDENKLRLFLKEDPLYFDKTLPYAIVFGLETEFIRKVKPIMKDLNIDTTQCDWDFISLSDTISTISSIATLSSLSNSSWSSSSYDSDSWWDSWSSFDSWWSDFDSWWGGGWGWWWSW